MRLPLFEDQHRGNPPATGSIEPAPTVRAVVNDDGAILIDSDRGVMFSLNRTGGVIWAGIRQQQTKEAICQQLTKQFGVSDLQAKSDLEEFLALLEEHRLVRRGTATS